MPVQLTNLSRPLKHFFILYLKKVYSSRLGLID